MKQIELKEVAKRFTEKYYPQWLSRVDRIWEMLENIDPNFLQAEPASSQYQQGNAFGIAGEIEPKFKEYMGGIAVFAFTCRSIQGDDGIGENEIKNQISITQTNLNISAGLQAKLENVLSEMLPSMIGDVIEADERKFEIHFTETEVRIPGQPPVNKTYSYTLLEHMILKESIHWIWGFVFLGRWSYGEVLEKHPRTQFGNYLSKEAKKLEKYGFVIDHKRGGDEWWLNFKKTNATINSNLLEARAQFIAAKSEFEIGNMDEVIIKLESAIAPIDYPNVIFIDAYKLLIRYIFQIKYENISENTLKKVTRFLVWYKAKLRRAILIIKKVYLEESKISKQEVGDELKNLEIESKEAESSYEAIRNKVSVTENVRDCEELIELVVTMQEKIIEITKMTEMTRLVKETILKGTDFKELRSNKYIQEIFNNCINAISSRKPTLRYKQDALEFFLLSVLEKETELYEHGNLNSLINLLQKKLRVEIENS